jgi:YbbR domain-containing protein
MIRWLVENVGLMLLALIIAVVVWIAAEWKEDPIIEDEFDQPIPVQVENQPPGTHLVDGWQREVRVRLRAPQSVWEQLAPDRFDTVLNLSPNLSPLEPGHYWIPVQVSLELEPAILLEVEPEFIEVELEAIRERLVPVTVLVQGEPDPGYQAGEHVVVSDTVKVRGPASQVDQVVQVVANISLRGARATVEEEAAALVPVDAEGKPVNGVTSDPERIQVRVPVEPLPNVKEMSVTVDKLGQPAEGYHVTNVGITPPVVRVLGPVFALNNLPGFLTTVPISIEGRTEDVVERLPLELPPGISMFDPDELAVQVTIEIAPFPGSVTVTRTLTFQGLRPGLMPIASPEMVEVILSGPQPRLSVLLPEDVRVILDLSGWRLGDQDQLEPVVVPPEGITVDSIIPSVIQVRIVREPAPTTEPQE